jgi:ribonuclease HI
VFPEPKRFPQGPRGATLNGVGAEVHPADAARVPHASAGSLPSDASDPMSSAVVAPSVSTVYRLEIEVATNPGRTAFGSDSGLVFAGAGIVVRTPRLESLGTYSVPLGFVRSRLHAEYLALLRGLEIARERHGASGLFVRAGYLTRSITDGERPRDRSLESLVARVRELADPLSPFVILWTPAAPERNRDDASPEGEALARRAAGLDGAR